MFSKRISILLISILLITFFPVCTSAASDLNTNLITAPGFEYYADSDAAV